MLAILWTGLAACAPPQDRQRAGVGRGRGGATPQVGFVVVRPTSVALTAQLNGRTTAFESSDVRPQVSGIIRRRFFTEGSRVRSGEPLYEIDPRIYQAAVDQARANLASAQANQEAAKLLEDRYKPLADIGSISKQQFTNAVASSRQASAAVAQSQAALETAEINLKFTTVPAPITGRIGRSLATVGALVSANQPAPLAQIQALDPMFVDIQQSSAEILALRNSLERDGMVAPRADVRLILEDGREYDQVGSVEFSETLVDSSTGTVTLRARFPNPDGVLLPGMFVRARFTQALDTRAFLVPQEAVARDVKGNALVYLVGPNNKALQTQVRAERALGQDWVVTDGLANGDRVIVQGLSKVSPNQSIDPVAASSPQRVEVQNQGKDRARGAG